MEIIDNFVTEKDFELLQNDKYTFFVLGRILKGECNFIASDHNKIIICHSCKPFPLWIWTPDNVSQQEMETVYQILLENNFLTSEYTFNLKYDLATFLISRASKDNKPDYWIRIFDECLL